MLVGHGAVVAEDRVVAGGDRDGVRPRATRHEVVAATGDDRIGAAEQRVAGAHRLHRQRGRVERRPAMVAEDQVGAVVGACIDGVAAVAAQDHVGASAAMDRVAGAVGGPDRFDALDLTGRQDPLGAGGLGDDPVVAQDDVVAAVTAQRIGAHGQGVSARRAARIDRRDRQHTGREHDVDARVAVDVIEAAFAVDLVAARAAGQVVSRLAAEDHVIAAAAVDGDHPGRGRRVDRVGPRVREAPSGAGGDRARQARVAAAILRGVAEDHQRRIQASDIDAPAAVDGDGVATPAAVDRRDGAIGGAGHGQLIVARAEQYLHDLQGAVGDARRSHAEAEQAGGAQGAGVGGAAAVVESGDRVQRRGFVHEIVGVERVRRRRLVGLAGQRYGVHQARQGAGAAGGVDVQRTAHDIQGVRPGLRGQPAAGAGHRYRIAGDAEVVAAEARVEERRHVDANAQHEQAVVPFGAVHGQGLDRLVRNPHTRAGHVARRHHQVVAELGALHQGRVRATAAVDLHRGVVGVEHRAGLRRRGQGEAADLEPVSPAAAIQGQRCQIVVDDELVAARAAVDRGGVGDAVAQVAAGGLDRGEDVRRGDLGVRAPCRLEELADLDAVRAAATVQRGRGAVVVDVELVVAADGVDLQVLGRAIVVDALELRMQRAGGHVVGERAHGREIGDELATQKEQVVAGTVAGVQRIRAVDDEDIRAGRAGVVDVDQVFGPAGANVDGDQVAALPAVDVDGVLDGSGDAVAGPVVRRHQGGQVVDGDLVAARLPEDPRVADQVHRLQEDRVAVRLAVDLDPLGFEGALQLDRAAGARIGIAVVATDRDEVPGLYGARRRQVHVVARAEGDIVAGGQRAAAADRDVGAGAQRDIVAAGDAARADDRDVAGGAAAHRGARGHGRTVIQGQASALGGEARRAGCGRHAAGVDGDGAARRQVGEGCGADGGALDDVEVARRRREPDVGARCHVLAEAHRPGGAHHHRTVGPPSCQAADAAGDHAAGVRDPDRAAACVGLQEGDLRLQHVRRRPDTRGSLQDRRVGDDVEGAGIARVEDGALRRHDGDRRRGPQQAQRDGARGVHVDGAAARLDEGAVGHGDGAAAGAIGVRRQGDHGTSGLRVDRAGGAEIDLVARQDRHRSGGAEDVAVDAHVAVRLEDHGPAAAREQAGRRLVEVHRRRELHPASLGTDGAGDDHRPALRIQVDVVVVGRLRLPEPLHRDVAAAADLGDRDGPARSVVVDGQVRHRRRQLDRTDGHDAEVDSLDAAAGADGTAGVDDHVVGRDDLGNRQGAARGDLDVAGRRLRPDQVQGVRLVDIDVAVDRAVRRQVAHARVEVGGAGGADVVGSRQDGDGGPDVGRVGAGVVDDAPAVGADVDVAGSVEDADPHVVHGDVGDGASAADDGRGAIGHDDRAAVGRHGDGTAGRRHIGVLLHAVRGPDRDVPGPGAHERVDHHVGVDAVRGQADAARAVREHA